MLPQLEAWLLGARDSTVEGTHQNACSAVLCVLRSYAGSRFVWEICMGERGEVGERAGQPFYYGGVIEREGPWALGVGVGGRGRA